MVRKQKNPDQGFWKHVFRWLVKFFCWPSAILYLKPKYFYEDKKVQKRYIKGNGILISNHLTGMDVVLYTLVFVRRYLRCIAGEKAFAIPKIRFWLKALGAIEAVRPSAQQDYIYQALDTLKRGGVIEIYPEARFPDRKGHELQPFKMSYIILAAQSGAPIIPCYHKGNYGLFQRTKVAIGKPIYTKDFFPGSNPTIEQINKMNDAVFQKMLWLQAKVE